MNSGVVLAEDASQGKESAHRITASGSIQALAVDHDVLFAGLQGGIIAAYALDTYELLSSVHAHEESVLGLSLSDEHDLLFSTGADSVVKVWSSHSLAPLYSLHSYHEVGDIFCVCHSSRKETAFFGAQNGSISWYHLKSGGLTSPRVSFSHSSRKHRFFDSRGPGGSLTSLQVRDASGQPTKPAGHRLTIRSVQYQPYAHKSYVYCMLLVKGLFRHDEEVEVLITGGGGGDIKLWRIDDLEETGLTQLFQFKNKGASVFSLAYSGSFLYVGLSEGAVHVYNLSSCQLVQRLSTGTADVSQIQIHKGMMCCGTSDGWVKACLSFLHCSVSDQP
jgi:di- and tripeptidase